MVTTPSSASSSTARDCSVTDASSTMESTTITGALAVAASVTASEEEVTTTATNFPRWFPTCCGKPILHGKPEALGFLVGMTGQITGSLGVMTFVVPALMYFSKLEAGCAVEAPEGETQIPECTGTVYGMKPSSLITTLVSAISLAVAILMPLFGAIIDYTPNRRAIGRTLALVYILSIIPQIFMGEETWFPLAICLLLLAITALSLTLCLHSYLPELTEEEEELNDLTKAFAAVPAAITIVFIIAVIAFATAFGVGGDEAKTAQIAASLGVIVIGACFSMAWGICLQKRPAAHLLQEGQSKLTAGFQQIYRTSKNLYRTNVALLWFYAAVAIGDIKPLASIALTFLSSQQQFTSMDVGVAAIVMFLTVIPGAMLSGFVCRKINPIRSSVLSVLSMTAVTIAGVVFLTGGGQKLQTYIVIACWGVVSGWKTTSTTMLVAAILPAGQSSEMMGFYLFADIALSWLPPLVFTVLNEAGLSERISLSSICFFFLASLVPYWKMGQYEDCRKAANRLNVVPADTLGAITEDEEVPPSPKDVDVLSPAETMVS